MSDRLGAVEFLEIDHQGRMFVLAENIPATAGDGAAAFVARYSPCGRLEGIYELPLDQCAAVPPLRDGFGRGRRLFPAHQNAVVDVVGVGFRS